MMGMRWLRFFLVFGLALMPPAPAWAEEESESEHENEQETSEQAECPSPLLDGEVMLITALRCGQPAFDVDRSLQLLLTEDILRIQAQSLPDALLETSGVFMQRTNAGAGSPFLRGMVGPDNLILVDGIRFNNSTFRTGPNQYLAQIDPASIWRVELMLGPGSVLYGSDAVGGVIQVMPLGWRKAFGLSAMGGMRYASHDQSSALWAESAWNSPEGGLLVGGVFRRFDTLRAGGGETQAISDHDRGAWRARARLRLGDNWELGLNYLGNRMRRAGRVDRIYEGRFRFYDNDDDLLWLDLRFRPTGFLRELRLAVSLHRTHEVADSYRCLMPDSPGASDADRCLGLVPQGLELPHGLMTQHDVYRDTVWTPGLLAHGEMAFWRGRLRLNTGLEAYGDLVFSGKKEHRPGPDETWTWAEAGRGNFSDGSSYLSLGAFVLAEGDLWRRGELALVASLGGRLSHFRAHAPEVPGLGDVDFDHTGMVGTAGVKYLHERKFMAYLNFSQGFRAPNLQEATVLGDTGSKFELPNDGLSPVSSHSLELGGRLNLAGLQLFANAFVSFLRDAIDERQLGEVEWMAFGLDPESVGDKPVVQRVNSATGLLWGMEGTL
ncbi:MAG: TonB-dependent receptor, partial [Deltaproteobacteria bacterium]|nr:TonB-dependent receptor [Deltaproteobacteria bacterium]